MANLLKSFRKMKMEEGELGKKIGMSEKLIMKACSRSLKAHEASGKPYLCKESSSEVYFSFPGSWYWDDWFTSRPVGDPEAYRDQFVNLFPSLRSIGVDEVAVVNEASFRRFEVIHKADTFQKEVRKAVENEKQIVFTGHSSGGPTAILATLWFLEEYMWKKPSPKTPRCVTFGSPLVGDRIIPHALRREKRDTCFIHFVMRYDIVPRLMLAPLSSIELGQLHSVLQCFNPKSPSFKKDSVVTAKEEFFVNVMRNASCVASHVASNLMGSANPLLGTLASFKELSPYRPFGTYIFCTGNGKLVVAESSDAVLQILCHSFQVQRQEEIAEVACKSLKEHLEYKDKLQGSLDKQNVAYLDKYLNELPFCSDESMEGEKGNLHTALNDLGVSTRGRLCLRAAGELQKQKQRNQDKINLSKIQKEIRNIQEYRQKIEVAKVGYYDSFKLQNHEVDFMANVSRLELAGMWDEIIEMLKKYELPDEFEGQEEWVKLGTENRRLVEPLDIANYYRHSKNDDTGPYMINGRPKRYRFPQRWLEHAFTMEKGSSSESCFWATVEELSKKNFEDMKKEIEDLETDLRKWRENGEIGNDAILEKLKTSKKNFEEMKEKMVRLEADLPRWIENGEIGKEVILDDSTFSKWWIMLPSQLRDNSCIAKQAYEKLNDHLGHVWNWNRNLV